jgi:hypothetical protein
MQRTLMGGGQWKTRRGHVDGGQDFVCALAHVDGKTAEWNGEWGKGGGRTRMIDRNDNDGGCGVDDGERRPLLSLG